MRYMIRHLRNDWPIWAVFLLTIIFCMMGLGRPARGESLLDWAPMENCREVYRMNDRATVFAGVRAAEGCWSKPSAAGPQKNFNYRVSAQKPVSWIDGLALFVLDNFGDADPYTVSHYRTFHEAPSNRPDPEQLTALPILRTSSASLQWDLPGGEEIETSVSRRFSQTLDVLGGLYIYPVWIEF